VKLNLLSSPWHGSPGVAGTFGKTETQQWQNVIKIANELALFHILAKHNFSSRCQRNKLYFLFAFCLH
jgi:hypothetical protein